jgi:Holliday junction resolvasome RuvABC endonuclease subunit
MISLGIDPGTRRIGYGIVRSEDNALEFVAAGILKIESVGDGGALVETKREIDRLFLKYKPDMISLEKLFFAKNQKTAMAVAQARGVILLAAEEYRAGGLSHPHTGICPQRSEVGRHGIWLCRQESDPQDGPPHARRSRSRHDR